MGAEELEIDVARLLDLIAAGAALELLDVREPWEYKLCHIATSRAIPLGELQERSDELTDDRPLVVICHHGMRSMNATLWLRRQGYVNAVNLSGGIDAWARLVDPTMARY
ncbi:MAG: sulfurtransferase [Rhodospirillaceae bacterium]|nr:sulfurtransferase [Rhodospirillaceae bacterium]